MKHSRRAVTLLEVIVAMIVLAVAVATVAQTVSVVVMQQQIVFERLLATQEAANAMDEVMGRETAELDAERLSSLTLSPAAGQRLAAARLAVQVAPPQPDGGRRVVVEVHWRGRAGRQPEAVRLVAWTYTAPEEAP